MAALALGRFMRADPAPLSRVWLPLALVIAANAPDLDFIPGILAGDARRYHHGPSHSLVAAALVALAFGGAAWWAGHRASLRFGLLTGVAVTSHLLLDMLSSYVDDRHGVAVLWPLWDERVAFPVPVFIGISLAPGAASFVAGTLHLDNVLAVLWELLIVAAVWSVVRTVDRRTSRVRVAPRVRVR